MVSVRIKKEVVKEIDSLVSERVFFSRNEA
ncbi:hypothetical protein SJAV_10840 [Sulfurisphaera javensis]|uniref:CopG family transcriptional regulator n=1 Tax=Sulfurisphaera javensis TaxID=2049879 RepID=A0AAT9GQT1_9CREN